MSEVLTRAIDSVAEAVLRSCGSNAAAAAAAGGQQQQQAAPGLLGQPPHRQQQLASETTQEGLAAAALVDVMLQVGVGQCLLGFRSVFVGADGCCGRHNASSMFVCAATWSPNYPMTITFSLGFTAGGDAAVPQLYPADVPTLLLPCFMAMAQLVGNEALPLPRQVRTTTCHFV
jgi:hypothetical protein